MYYVGVDLGGTNIAVGIVDENKKILFKGSVPTIASREGDLIIKDMAALVEKLLKSNKISLEEVAYVGIATPGTVDDKNGIVERAYNLPFNHFPIAEIFKRYLPVDKVFVANDANAAALGEAKAGAARGSRNSVMITLGTGVGGGIIIDGKIYSGSNGAAGELGHIVIDYNGRQCTCGRRGCWEAYSSATALSAVTKEKVIECDIKAIPTLMVDEYKAVGKVTARTAFAAMKKGDKVAAGIVDYYIEHLACGIASIINIFQPEIICIGGGICNERGYLLDPLNELVEREQYTRENPQKSKIVVAELGNDAGIIGAACLGM
ncbi:MAG: ROK family protein [Ruminococcaceae bacterium]|nr:ROK family protein [Oscillospiraceae bacterium]